MDGHPAPREGIRTPDLAGYQDFLRGGDHGKPGPQEAAARVLALWPEARKLSRMAWDFHVRAALEAVQGAWTVRGERWAAAGGGIIAAAGFRPEWDGARFPHREAATLAPEARWGYCDAAPGLALAWQGALWREPRASAWQARGADPAAVLAGAEAAGLRPPFHVSLQQVLHWWPRDAAVRVLSDYGRVLGRGSSVALSWAGPGSDPVAAAEVWRVISGVAGVPAHAYAEEDAEAVIRDAGLMVHPHGAHDVRVHGTAPELRDLLRRKFRHHRAPGRFLDVVALVR